MSVIVAKRKQSMIEYIDTARKLAEIIPDRMENLLRKINNKYSNIKYISNRIFGYYYEMPVKLVTDAYLYVTEANRLFTKNEKLLERRKKLLDLAVEDYNKLQSVLSIVFSKFKDYINYNAIKNIIDLINTEVNLIHNNKKYIIIKYGDSEIPIS